MRFLHVFALLVVSLPAMAGGFYVEIFRPTDKARAVSADAFLVARLIGCHQPERGSVSARAIGFVNGERKSVAAKVIPMGTPGMFAVSRTWPADGTWVLHIDGSHPDLPHATTTLVKASGKQYSSSAEKLMLHSTTKKEIEAGIRSLLD